MTFYYRLSRLFFRFFADIKEVPEVLKTNHFNSLDGLRGVSIIAVLIAHFNQHLGEPILGAIIGNGVFGVYIFFVISGFLITSLLLKERITTGTISLRNFYFRRAFRILPLAWLFVIVVGLLNSIIGLEIPATDFLMAIFFLVNFYSFYSVTYYFNHYWSLSAEEQFYILIPPLIKWNINVYRYVLFLLFALTFLCRLLFNFYPGSFVAKAFFDLTRNLDGLLIGSFFSILVFQDMIPWTWLKKHKVLLNVLLLALVLLLKGETEIVYLKPFFNHSFYGILIGIILVNNLPVSNDVFFRILNNKVLARVGIISYSIYIWQQLFTSRLFHALFPYNMVLIFLVSFASYYGVEKYFLKLKERFKPEKKRN